MGGNSICSDLYRLSDLFDPLWIRNPGIIRHFNKSNGKWYFPFILLERRNVRSSDIKVFERFPGKLRNIKP
jgi:hypothetical protein